MKESTESIKPNDIAPKLVFYSLRCLFSLINRKNKDKNPKDYPGSGSIKLVD